MLLSYALASPFSGRVYNSLGAKMSIFIGMLLTAIGTFCIIIFGFETGYVFMCLASIVSGIGLGIANPSITTAAIGSVKESRASLAGGNSLHVSTVGSGAWFGGYNNHIYRYCNIRFSWKDLSS
jgi:MFS family permease